MEYPVWIQVIIALFAVFGVYAMLRVLAEAIFTSGNIGVAVHVRTGADVLLLEEMLKEAADTVSVRKKQPLMVLFYPEAARRAFDESGVPVADVRELLVRYHANYCLTE